MASNTSVATHTTVRIEKLEPKLFRPRLYYRLALIARRRGHPAAYAC